MGGSERNSLWKRGAMYVSNRRTKQDLFITIATEIMEVSIVKSIVEEAAEIIVLF